VDGRAGRSESIGLADCGAGNDLPATTLERILTFGAIDAPARALPAGRGVGLERVAIRPAGVMACAQDTALSELVYDGPCARPMSLLIPAISPGTVATLPTRAGRTGARLAVQVRGQLRGGGRAQLSCMGTRPRRRFSRTCLGRGHGLGSAT